MNHYSKGKFASSDYTFCANVKCKKRKTCARNFERYPEWKNEIVSMSNFICEEENYNDNNMPRRNTMC